MVMIRDQFGRRLKLVRPKVGEVIKIATIDTRETKVYTTQYFTVVRHYRDYILCKTRSGQLTAFTNGELVQNGLAINEVGTPGASQKKPYSSKWS